MQIDDFAACFGDQTGEDVAIQSFPDKMHASVAQHNVGPRRMKRVAADCAALRDISVAYGMRAVSAICSQLLRKREQTRFSERLR